MFSAAPVRLAVVGCTRFAGQASPHCYCGRWSVRRSPPPVLRRLRSATQVAAGEPAPPVCQRRIGPSAEERLRFAGQATPHSYCGRWSVRRSPPPAIRRLRSATQVAAGKPAPQVCHRRTGPSAEKAHALVWRGALQRDSAQCCLTPRSSGAPTAGHQARAGGTLYIFTGPGLASCRRRPLSSNVGLHKTSHAPLQQKVRLAPWA